jgi:hypothetical protein
VACVPSKSARFRMRIRRRSDHKGPRMAAAWPHSKIKKYGLEWCYSRSRQVRRQGLEPRTAD